MMSKEAFQNEANMMKTLSHPNIVKLLGVCSDTDQFCIISEYICNGSLLVFLRYGSGQQLSLPEMINIAAKVASGMAYIESQNLIHRDLAARNILVGENNIIKIADFGLARLISDDDYYITKSYLFPVKWSALESVCRRKFSIKSDVWSFAILLHELFTKGEVPYPGLSNDEVICKLQRGYRMPRHPAVPMPVYDKMRSCWKEEEQDRPTFANLYSFFNNYTFEPQPQPQPNRRGEGMGQKESSNGFLGAVVVVGVAVLAVLVFLVACTRLYTSLCRSVSPSVRPSVRRKSLRFFRCLELKGDQI